MNEQLFDNNVGHETFISADADHQSFNQYVDPMLKEKIQNFMNIDKMVQNKIGPSKNSI